MAKNDKKRQQKLEKKRMDRKAKQKSAAQLNSASPQDRMRIAAQWPIYECLTMSFIEGMTQVWISRRNVDGRFAEAHYLLDTYGIGVKDVFSSIAHSAQRWAECKEDAVEEVALIPCTPAYARKLVEQTVAYSRTLGIEPPKDYATAAILFGDIDASECSDEFTFGYEGKPAYIVGPEDRPQDILKWSERIHAGGGEVSLEKRPDLLNSLDEEDFEDEDFDDELDGEFEDDFDDDDLIETEAVRHEPKGPSK